MKPFRIRLRRVVWKQAPSLEAVTEMQIQTLFGPDCFERGNEWLFLRDRNPYVYAETPKGWRRIGL